MAKRKQNIWPFGKRTTYRVTRKPGPGLSSTATTFKGFKVWQAGDSWRTSADPESAFDSLKDAKAFITWQQRNPGKSPKSAAYEAGRRALAAAAAKLGTVNLSPSIAQRDDWGWSWREFMAGWNAEKKATPNPGRSGLVTAHSLTLSSTAPGADSVVRGPFNRVSSGVPVKILQRGKGRGLSGRVLIAADQFGIPYWGWVDKGAVEQSNPSAPGSAFKRCVAAVTEKGGAYDPRAVCAAAGRKKYGAKKFAAMAAAGRKKAARGNPGSLSENEAIRLLEIRYGLKLADAKKALVSWAAKHSSGKYTRKSVEAIGTRGNPAAAAAEVYEEFHGRPSDEVVTVSQKVHFHKHLAALGELRKIVVLVGLEFLPRLSASQFLKFYESHKEKKSVDQIASTAGIPVATVRAYQDALVDLTRFRKALLCTNEKKNQLYVMGGDQSVDLPSFGIRDEHEVHTLGKAVEVDYFTRKDHLGDEGGLAVYFHIHGTTNQAGKHVMSGNAPDLIYRVRDEALEFSGGSYTIRAEGVDK